MRADTMGLKSVGDGSIRSWLVVLKLRQDPPVTPYANINFCRSCPDLTCKLSHIFQACSTTQTLRIDRDDNSPRHDTLSQLKQKKTSFYEKKKIETKVIPQSTELVKSVEERRNPISLNYSALCTPPYRKKRDENLFASSILASSPLIPRPSVLHANTSSFIRKNETPQYSHSIVVAIDFGTAYSGYAYSFTRDPENVHIMRKWEGDDPGMNNQKKRQRYYY
ncbi:unnamed protein product [Lepeophtheirus salmonis]|uniref:(salmon louse) hypothetical protein n=1 Tax=Lepeophtheirus salmonis TaxID=72036 RepID=A0A7R8H3V4_LEPSM|nr:unnamed protein product [Lepeophtheirus salmonis]CAF2840058.1 unnamed protein product [Lepeophtheirus salmonis]